jgi:hypothetical protein
LTTLAVELISLGFILGTLGVFAAMGYYAIKILRGFKGGVLHQGWNLMAASALFFIVGQLFLLGGAGQALRDIGIAQDSIALGSALETIGGLLLVMGFRTQYNIWNPKQLLKNQQPAKQKQIETVSH